MKSVLFSIFVAGLLISPDLFAQDDEITEASEAVSVEKDLPNGLYALFTTDKGEIVAELHYKKAPLTVTNFVGLAEGTKNSIKQFGQPFYDGLKFHRVLENFMIQTGDPIGTGNGDPGYKFEDEFHPSLKHTGPGILSMANTTKDTNGSQFFITHKATPWLDGKHSVFGKVKSGQDVVDAVEQDNVLKSVEIVRIGLDAKLFSATQADFEQRQIEHRHPNVQFLESGLGYIVRKVGDGVEVNTGSEVTVHYAGTLFKGKREFDSSRKRQRPYTFTVGKGHVIAGWDEGVLGMRRGETRTLIVPPELGYGSDGLPPKIPKNARLVFEIELIDVR
jgi:peptidyl-prolyl cis-trans isomerase A (cyclophilin A)